MENDQSKEKAIQKGNKKKSSIPFGSTKPKTPKKNSTGDGTKNKDKSDNSS